MKKKNKKEGEGKGEEEEEEEKVEQLCVSVWIEAMWVCVVCVDITDRSDARQRRLYH